MVLRYGRLAALLVSLVAPAARAQGAMEADARNDAVTARAQPAAPAPAPANRSNEQEQAASDDRSPAPDSGETVVEVPPERAGYFFSGRLGPAAAIATEGLYQGAGGALLAAAAGFHTRAGAGAGLELGSRVSAGQRGYVLYNATLNAFVRYAALPALRWHPLGEMGLGLYLFHVRGDEYGPTGLNAAFGGFAAGGFEYDLSDRFSLDVTLRGDLMTNGLRTLTGRATPFDLWLTLNVGLVYYP